MMLLIGNVLLLAGAFFVLVAAVGVLRMPDLPMRMHAATKAGTLGAGLLLLSVAWVNAELGVVVRALAAIVFLMLTAPVAAQMIARAAYLRGSVKLWEGTFVDELRRQHALDDGATEAEADHASAGWTRPLPH